MCEIPPIGAFSIIPSNDLPAAIPLWQRLGFARTGGDANDILMTGWGCGLHLIQAADGPWRVPLVRAIGLPFLYITGGRACRRCAFSM
jgi:hypothetical protein